MSRNIVLLFITATFLAGCGVSKFFAPIRDIGRTSKAAEYYIVQRGDTLYKIAFQYGLDTRDLAVWNGLADINLIRAGERLRLLPPRAAKVGQPVSEAARRPPINPADPGPEPDFEPSTWIWPLTGKILAGFNETTGNKGLDIAGVIGERIVSTTEGKVVYTGEGLRGYGKLTIIRHSPTTLSAYAHQSRILVSEGQAVKQGQKIGEVGDSDADRVKLHFEIRRFGRPMDPLLYLSRTE